MQMQTMISLAEGAVVIGTLTVAAFATVFLVGCIISFVQYVRKGDKRERHRPHRRERASRRH